MKKNLVNLLKFSLKSILYFIICFTIFVFVQYCLNGQISYIKFSKLNSINIAIRVPDESFNIHLANNRTISYLNDDLKSFLNRDYFYLNKLLNKNDYLNDNVKICPYVPNGLGWFFYSA